MRPNRLILHALGGDETWLCLACYNSDGYYVILRWHRLVMEIHARTVATLLARFVGEINLGVAWIEVLSRNWLKFFSDDINTVKIKAHWAFAYSCSVINFRRSFFEAETSNFLILHRNNSLKNNSGVWFEWKFKTVTFLLS